MEVNHSELRTLIRQSYKVKRALFIWGAVGIGKSQMARQVFMEIAKEKNREFIEWCRADEEQKKDIEANPQKYLVFVDDRVALKDSTDNKGVPKIFDGEKYLKWIKTMIMNISAKKNSMVIWFKDEINMACPMVQAAEYQIVLDRALDDLSFAPNTYVFAAGNRQEDRASVFDLSDPLNNRFLHCVLAKPSNRAWRDDFALKNDIDTRIVGFHEFKAGLLWRRDPKSKDNAFPTHRSWEMCSDMIKGVKDEALLELFTASAVGDGAASEFVSWWKLNVNIDVEAILANPDKINEITKLDLKYVAVVGIVEKFKEDKQKYLNPALECCQRLLNNPELGALLMRMMAEVDAKYWMVNTHKFKNYDKLVEGYSKYLQV